VLLWILVLRTCFSASSQSWLLLMELIFRVSGTVLLIGIARMVADPALGEDSSSTDVLEDSDFG
jgi:hypothetical protein